MLPDMYLAQIKCIICNQQSMKSRNSSILQRKVWTRLESFPSANLIPWYFSKTKAWS